MLRCSYLLIRPLLYAIRHHSQTGPNTDEGRGDKCAVLRQLPKTLKIKIYRNIIFPVVLYGSETWSLTLMEERRLRVCENRVLRRIDIWA